MISNPPHIIDGMVQGNNLLVFPQDPSSKNSIQINRSNNASGGLEFTWSTWLFINDSSINVNTGNYKHIFSKGNETLGNDGMIIPDNAPGLYIDKTSNNIVVVMNTYIDNSIPNTSINELITIEDIPLNKWFNVMIICKNKNVDVLINGLVSKSVELNTIPKQNYGNVYVGFNGGFDGNLSDLWYYDYCLGTYEIQTIMNNGPNTKASSVSKTGDKTSNYLSLRWYFGDGYY